MNHPCIIHPEDVIAKPNFLFIVLELTGEGELLDKITEKTKLNEAEAKLHFLQIAWSVKCLHFKKICQRDTFPAFPSFPTVSTYLKIKTSLNE